MHLVSPRLMAEPILSLSPGCMVTGSDSPVSAAWSTCRSTMGGKGRVRPTLPSPHHRSARTCSDWPARRTASAGTMSPSFTCTRPSGVGHGRSPASSSISTVGVQAACPPHLNQVARHEVLRGHVLPATVAAHVALGRQLVLERLQRAEERERSGHQPLSKNTPCLPPRLRPPSPGPRRQRCAPRYIRRLRWQTGASSARRNRPSRRGQPPPGRAQ